MRKSNDPIFWSLFAMFIPILIVFTGLVIPFDLVGEEPFVYERTHGAVAHPVIKIFIFAFIALPLFHFAHRFRSILSDVGLMDIRFIISLFCYGSAIVGTVITAFVLWRF